MCELLNALFLFSSALHVVASHGGLDGRPPGDVCTVGLSPISAVDLLRLFFSFALVRLLLRKCSVSRASQNPDTRYVVKRTHKQLTMDVDERWLVFCALSSPTTTDELPRAHYRVLAGSGR